MGIFGTGKKKLREKAFELLDAGRTSISEEIDAENAADQKQFASLLREQHPEVSGFEIYVIEGYFVFECSVETAEGRNKDYLYHKGRLYAAVGDS